MPDLTELRTNLQRFIDGDDRSRAVAGAIEVALDELFDEEEPFASAVDALAQYAPGGGELLYGGEEVAAILRTIVRRLPER